MSVKTYSLKKNGDKKLSEHFKVREFRCKDGTDKILIEKGLVTYLEKVYAHFNCSKINITSAYRTPTHDKAVGGKGSGNHCEGKAVDFVAYRQNGEKIPSKEISLYLEDLGVKGIGYRCGGSSTATHMDINYRTRKWYGDEKYSMSASIGSSFYDYFHITWKKKSIKATSLKLRSDVGLGSNIKYTLPRDTKLEVSNTDIIEKDGFDWTRVKYKKKIYWVAEKYLK